MFEFEWLVMFLFLPLPLLLRKIVPAARETQAQALNVPFLEDFQQTVQKRKKGRNRLLLLLAGLAWISLVTAAAKPVWIGKNIDLPASGRNIMLAVDLSGSMRERDFLINGRVVNRLVATKSIAGDFIKRREGDRIGLILFGDAAFVQSPLTLDRQTVFQLLQETQINLVGQNTAMGDAIGLAVKRANKHPDQKQILILMTDGEASIGVDVAEATEIAANAGLKIYTIGIGSVQPGGFFGRRSTLDEKTLRYVAEKTGGQYFPARNTQQLEEIYKEVDKLEPIAREREQWRPRTDLFTWPLALSLLLALLVIILRVRQND
jgi:Ca-activated chloride channel family protein